MFNLDRFSQRMYCELPEIRDPLMDYGRFYESDPVPPVLCACGCGEEIDLSDYDSYIEPVDLDDVFILDEPSHIEVYNKENDQLVGSQSK